MIIELYHQKTYDHKTKIDQMIHITSACCKTKHKFRSTQIIPKSTAIIPKTLPDFSQTHTHG